MPILEQFQGIQLKDLKVFNENLRREQDAQRFAEEHDLPIESARKILAQAEGAEIAVAKSEDF